MVAIGLLALWAISVDGVRGLSKLAYEGFYEVIGGSISVSKLLQGDFSSLLTRNSLQA